MIANGGIPKAFTDLTIVVPFNDLEAVERALIEHEGRVAGMLLEPVMMNAGIIPPDPGYLQGLKDLLHRHGALMAFDEVKTGFTTGPGGATALYGVTPDIVCLAKALGGGIAVSAIGGTREVMSAIVDGRYDQVGTFNGNPLAMAAARATLSGVLTADTYTHLDSLASQCAWLNRSSTPRKSRKFRTRSGVNVTHPFAPTLTTLHAGPYSAMVASICVRSELARESRWV